jgi:hypothetical protein
MIYVVNAFSLSMVPRDMLALVRFAPIAVRPVLAGLEWSSAVGHADTAAMLGVPCARVAVAMHPGDTVYVAQLAGCGRLPEGTTTLPPGARFEWVAVTMMPAA